MGIKASFGGGIVAAVMAATALSSTVCADAQTTELKYDWGVCDTLAMYNVGPGITYSKLVYHDKPLIIWLVARLKKSIRHYDFSKRSAQ